ncbi:hypothetical protein GCM10018793_49390 [Streptomyces sulfonofaciens]|uniref:Uncharacterized protein n=1 Tax=Streptomyces sulfonofaciens TaxID=68272 RepID=A0A919L4E9_9ACTN|nr:hypothetical protein [Streptomyces sulfonofaciens]GHH84580.1 hypothetical protein GCM10018793_49390 [Streptomyces sulfonofaciens]
MGKKKAMQGAGKGGARRKGGEQPADAAAAAAIRAARFGRLPSRVEPSQMVEETPAQAPHDPDFGRNPENDWMIRYSAG